MFGIEKYEDYPHLDIMRELKLATKDLPTELKNSVMGFNLAFKSKPISEVYINKSVIIADQIVNWYESDFEGSNEDKIENVKEVIDEHIQNITVVQNNEPVNSLEKYLDTHLPNGGKVHSDTLFDENITVPIRPLMGFKEYTYGKYKVIRKAFDSYLYISKI